MAGFFRRLCRPPPPEKQVSIRGAWEGVYRYGPVAAFDAPPPTCFEIDIRRQIWGQFRGIVRDDPESGQAEAGTVSGMVAGNHVRFVKRMPVLYFCDEGRFQHVAEWARDVLGAGVVGEIPGQPVMYTGRLSAAGDEMAGRWWIAAGTVTIPTDAGVYRLDCDEVCGTWVARRAAEQLRDQPPDAAHR